MPEIPVIEAVKVKKQDTEYPQHQHDFMLQCACVKSKYCHANIRMHLRIDVDASVCVFRLSIEHGNVLKSEYTAP